MTIFAAGVTDPYIKLIQRALNETCHLQLSRDGNFGPATQGAFLSYAAKNGLTVPTDKSYSGVAADKLDVYISNRFLNAQDYVRSAQTLSCEVASVKAVKSVESGGEGFLMDGRSTILFERHIFKRRLDAAMAANANFIQALKTKLNVPTLPGLSLMANVQQFLNTNYADIYNASPGGYSGSAANAAGAEHDRLNRAAEIDPNIARESASWGLFQIMGYWWSNLHYSSVMDFTSKVDQSEHNQIDAFVLFIKNNTSLLTAIQSKDWTSFARGYNGSNYSVNHYDTKLATAYAANS
jgi:peptidoglycan hydrolase-like protein with peptidoglycan-binding domain